MGLHRRYGIQNNRLLKANFGLALIPLFYAGPEGLYANRGR